MKAKKRRSCVPPALTRGRITSCSAKIIEALRGDAENESLTGVNINGYTGSVGMMRFETQAAEIIERAPGVRSFRLKAPGDFDFKPGQFFFLTITINGREHTKCFSFSNSPTEKGYIEFTKRLTGSEFSNALAALEPGGRAVAEGPAGRFIYEGEEGKAAFLSGGIGITPIRSICGFLADKGICPDVVLLYANRTEKDIIFREDFDRMAASWKNLKIVHTLTSAETDAEKWGGRTGRIDGAMVSEEIPDCGERTFYICGPPPMVSSLQEVLSREMRIGGGRIVTENFAGY